MSLSSQLKTQPPETITDRNKVLTFGKYKGKTIQFVLDFDPQYLLFCQEKIEWFDLDHKILDEVEDEQYSGP